MTHPLKLGIVLLALAGACSPRASEREPTVEEATAALLRRARGDQSPDPLRTVRRFLRTEGRDLPPCEEAKPEGGR